MEPRVARAIEEAVKEAMGPSDAAGSVVVIGDQIELRPKEGAAGQPVASINVEQLSQQWTLLPEGMRQRKASELAQGLVDARGKTSRAPVALSIVEPPPEPPRVRPPEQKPMTSGLMLLIAGVLLAGGYVGARATGLLSQGDEAPKASAGPRTETPAEAVARRARVCEAARKRIFAGSSIGPFDTEGWVVELWLARSTAGEDIAKSPAITGIIADGKLAAGADEVLAALSDSPAEIVPAAETPDAPSSPGWSSVTVRFSGKHAGAFLDTATRSRFLTLAERAALGARAEVGALYGRCAHLRFHDLGAWFYGADPPLAGVAIAASMGLFTELAAVRKSAAPPGGELDALRKAAEKLDVPALVEITKAHGGLMSVRSSDPRGAVTVTFPLGGPTRATSASRSVARAIGLSASD